MIEGFLRREDRRLYSLSQSELERRWKAIRERMAAKGIDHLVFQSQQRYMGGYFLWFTDLTGTNFGITAIFPQDDDMTIITHGPGKPTSRLPLPIWPLRGIKEVINTPAFINVNWQDTWHAEKAVEVIMRKKPNTIGLVGLGNMSAALYENLQKTLKGINIVNASELVDEVRMVKSEEELKYHREAAYLHEMSYDIAKQAIRPGRTAIEVIEEIRHAQVLKGSEEQQIMINFGQVGSPKYTQGSWGNSYIRRKFRDGDIIDLLIESSIACGYWYDLRRFLCIGRIADDLQEAREIALEARARMAGKLKPGASLAEGLKASDEFLKSKGCPPETRAAGHGQGVDLVERPIVCAEEPAKVEVGMVIALHPTARTEKAEVCIADTYVIANCGAVPLYNNLFDDNEVCLIR